MTDPPAEAALVRYPRTHHLEGSRLQPGDEDLSAVPLATLRGRHVVVEEKVDGANAAISFDRSGRLLLQSRGHFLLGGARERHFALFKTWAATHRAALWDRLGDRHILYGEWLHARHTVFYDALPHFFLEFDVWERGTGRFLDTPSRRRLLADLPVCSVPVLHEGEMPAPASLVGRSLFKSPDWRGSLQEAVHSSPEVARWGDPDRAVAETDPSDQAEGLYVKVEEGGAVVARYKYVRSSFLAAVLDSATHWLERPIVENRLAPGVDLFATHGAP